MPENSTMPAPESWTSPRWIARLVMAFLLAVAIWAFLVSLTNNLILPLLAGVMGGDPASPMNLGKRVINVPGLFSSVLELCLAGLVALVLSLWSQRKPRMVRKLVRVSSTTAPRAAAAGMPAARPATTQKATAPAPASLQSASPSAPPPTQKATPEPPKEVYYNIVGEPINPTEND